MRSQNLTGNVTAAVQRLYNHRLSYRRQKKREKNKPSEREGKTMKLTVKFRDANSVKDFVKITSQYSEDLSLVHGRYVVDAKSILGIFSMDLTKPLDLVGDGANDDLKEDLKAYVV
jgi:phosphotransferase system HPr-like phosphotransfer protein